jgi:hypothetical protein
MTHLASPFLTPAWNCTLLQRIGGRCSCAASPVSSSACSPCSGQWLLIGSGVLPVAFGLLALARPVAGALAMTVR